MYEYQIIISTWGNEMKTSLAPPEVVISLDHTDGVPGSGLDHVAHRGDDVLLRVVFQYVVIPVTIISTFNNDNELNKN